MLGSFRYPDFAGYYLTGKVPEAGLARVVAEDASVGPYLIYLCVVSATAGALTPVYS